MVFISPGHFGLQIFAKVIDHHGLSSIYTVSVVDFILTTAALFVQLCLFYSLPKCLPRSFTLGELTVVTQGASTFLLYASHLYLISVRTIYLGLLTNYCFC
jgi:hypothetical protein